MNCREAYNKGFNCGNSSAEYCEFNASYAKDNGCAHDDDKVCRDCATSAAYDSEMGARDYSPWEFIASEINNAEEFRSEQLWEWYDKGVTAGIKAGISERFGRKRYLEI